MATAVTLQVATPYSGASSAPGPRPCAVNHLQLNQAFSHKVLVSRHSSHTLSLSNRQLRGSEQRFRRTSRAQKPQSSLQGQEYRVGQDAPREVGGNPEENEVAKGLVELRDEILSMHKEGDVAGASALLEANTASVLEQVREEEAGEEQIAMLLALSNCCCRMDMAAKARVLADEASRVVLQLEEDSVVPLEIVEMMGDAYVDVGVGEVALAFYLRAMEERQQDGDSAMTVSAAGRQALHLIRSGMEEEASSLYRALAVMFSDSDALPDILVAHGTTLLTCGRCQEARDVCQRALELQRKRWGSNHLNTGYTMTLIAHSLIDIAMEESGQKGEEPSWASLKPGADYLRSSVAILEEHNDDSPECKNFLQQARDLLATLLDTHNQYEEAVDLLERNFKAVAHQVGPDDSLTFGPLMRLAHLHYAEEQYGRAGSFLDQVLGIIVGSEAKCDELLCEPLALKAMCEAGLGREKQAEGFARSAVEVALKYYAPDDVTTGVARQALATVLFASRKYKEATEVLLENLNILTRDSGELCERSEETLELLIGACAAADDKEQLEALQKRFSLTRTQIEAALASLAAE